MLSFSFRTKSNIFFSLSVNLYCFFINDFIFQFYFATSFILAVQNHCFVKFTSSYIRLAIARLFADGTRDGIFNPGTTLPPLR